MIITPFVWMGVTETSTDPGLPGHFYYHYIFLQFVIFLSNFTALWGLLKVQNKNTSSSLEAEPSSAPSEKKETFAGFTLDELNGQQQQQQQQQQHQETV